MHDGILSSPAIVIDPRLVVSGLLLDSGPGFHHQQNRLLQQSPGGSRQISGGQATINFACSCTPDHAEKEVRPDRSQTTSETSSTGFQSSKGSSSRLVCWSTDVFMGTLHPIYRRCSLQMRMFLVVDRFDQLPVGTWSFRALELLDMAQGCSPSLVHLSGTHFLSDCGTSA